MLAPSLGANSVQGGPPAVLQAAASNVEHAVLLNAEASRARYSQVGGGLSSALEASDASLLEASKDDEGRKSPPRAAVRTFHDALLSPSDHVWFLIAD